MSDVAVTIRAEHPDDHAAIARVVEAAFGSSAEAELVDRIRSSAEYVPEMALVAVADDATVVGHVMISGAAIVDDDGGSHPVVMLSPLAVDPALHGRGVGGRLVRAVTAIADRRGEPFVLLEGAPAYYSRFGFGPAADHGITMPLPDWAPAEAAQILTFATNDGSRRGRVVYPAAFDGLE